MHQSSMPFAAVVMYDGNQRSKQYAFVTYEHNEATVRALNDRSMVIDGRLVDVRSIACCVCFFSRYVRVCRILWSSPQVLARERTLYEDLSDFDRHTCHIC